MNEDPGQTRPASAFALGALAIFALVLAAYWPALGGGFVWDDGLVVGKNPLIRGELSLGAVWFRTDFPLTTVALWLQWLLWGMKPAGYHVVNVVLHGLDAVLLWRLLAKLRVRGAWLAGALFAVHPVCVASAAWISEQKNTLSMAFFLISVWCYVRMEQSRKQKAESRNGVGANPPSTVPVPLRISDFGFRTSFGFRVSGFGFYFLSLAAFLLALLSKTSTVMLPVVLLALCWWRTGRVTRFDVARSIPFFLLALVFGLLTVWFQKQGAIGTATIQTGNFWARLAGAGWAIWFYFGKGLLPLNLNAMYPNWEIDAASLRSYVPLLLWAGVLGLCWRFRRGWGRHAFFGLFCFTVTLFPVLGFFDMFFLTISRVSDHFQYLPITALVALVAAAGEWTKQKLGKQKGNCTSCAVLKSSDPSPWPPPHLMGRGNGGEARASAPTSPPSPLSIRWRGGTGVRSAVAFWTVLLLGGLSVLSFQRAKVFATEEGLWRDTLQRNPQAWSAQNNLGCILAAKQDLESALACFETSLRLHPDNPRAHDNVGQVFLIQGRRAEAEAHFEAALRIKPHDAEAHRLLAEALTGEGKDVEALGHLREAMRLDPDFDTRMQIVALLQKAGDTRQVLAELREAVARQPNLPQALNNLAWLLATAPDAQLRDGAKAVQMAEKACGLTQYQQPVMIGTLAAAYAEAGRFNDAVAAAQKAIDLAQAAGDGSFAALNRQLLERYRSGKAWHVGE
jgi:protein O-mannosyl-transferase